MNSTTISTSNIFALLMVSSGIWACTEKPAADVDWRAGDATTDHTDGSVPEEPSVPEGEQPEDLGEEPGDPNGQIPPPDEEGCHAIYAQDLFPTFELTIDEDTWDELEWEWKNGAKQKQKGLDVDPWHPLTEFRYGDIVINNAEIRLRGNATYWHNSEDKFQFQITFDRVSKYGNFLGLESIVLDSAPANRHMLRDRLAWSMIRDMGVIAPCANNARLEINGEFYGVFTNVEKIDKLFLERNFDNPSGDLWKRQNWNLQTNKKTATDDRLDELNDADSIEELQTWLDVEQALTVYAAEALIPDSDGGWAGGLNFYVYDDPLSGVFKLIPWDMDSTFERFNDGPEGMYPDNPDPVVWHKQERFHGRPWYDMALEDEDLFWYYIETLKVQFDAAYDVDVLHEKIQTWTEQIKASVLEDDNKPFDNDTYLDKVDELEDFVEERHEWLLGWFECWEQGGEPDDDGYCDD
jgi:spore coat protein CotH